MKREELKELGLEKDVIDKIMKMNGEDINSTKEDSKRDIETKNKEIETLNTSIKNVQKDLKKYQDMNVDDIKKNADDWESKFNDSQKEIQDIKNNTLLEKSLSLANAYDNEMLLKVLDHDKINFTNGKVEGLDEQLKELQKDKPFLFKKVEGETKGDGKDEENRFDPLDLGPSTGGEGKAAMETAADEIFGIK